jgi:glyoxylase-like metal-dependent hydrolase (beta-lactamase superfamily II)
LNRRELLKSALAGTAALGFPSLLPGQQSAGVVSRLTPTLAVVDVRGNNILCCRKVQGLVLVDSGAPKTADQVIAAIRNMYGPATVEILFNTHYHPDQTGNNEVFAAAGAKIIAHDHTRQWMSTDHWVPPEDRWEKARPKAAWPTETFRTTSSSRVQRLGGATEEIEYGHLPLAHTDGDIYVFFKTSNVLAVGGVASPILDPELDWFTGAWIGGRLDAMDTILQVSNEQTRIVPASGPVMTRAEFKEERDMMEEVRSRVWKRTLQGDSPREMLEAGVLNGLVRTWKDPYKFLYDVGQGMFAHHNKLDPSVI